MLKYPPIYTEETKCQDCYKCLRSCPVKAIKVENKCATIIRDHCIACGHCVEVCPNGAKKVRSDLRFARKALEQHSRVMVSLAPSFVNEFSGIQPAQVIAAIRKLGFFGVSETALGAQQVSAHTVTALRSSKQKVMFSSACPTAVEFIRKYHPEHADKITNLMSPLLTHAKMLRRTYGDDIGVVSIGPCIAAKREADERADLVDVALTFEELHDWLKEKDIHPEEMEPCPDDHFIPRKRAKAHSMRSQAEWRRGSRATRGSVSTRSPGYRESNERSQDSTSGLRPRTCSSNCWGVPRVASTGPKLAVTKAARCASAMRSSITPSLRK